MSNSNAQSQLPLTITDLVCVDDLDPGGSETTSDLQALQQDLYHILVEAFGSNPDDPNRGIGVEGLLGGTSANLQAAASSIDSQFRKDDRVEQSQTTLTYDPSADEYTIGVQVVPVGSLLPLALGYTYSKGQGLVPTP